VLPSDKHISVETACMSQKKTQSGKSLGGVIFHLSYLSPESKVVMRPFPGSVDALGHNKNLKVIDQF
jgi:hypothetical protein